MSSGKWTPGAKLGLVALVLAAVYSFVTRGEGAAPAAVSNAAGALAPDVIAREATIAAKREEQAQAPAPLASGAAASRPHLRTTVSQLRHWYERADIVFHSAPLADGTPRLLGRHPDGLTMVELIGPGDELQSASITIGVAKDNADLLLRNTAALMVFMRETGWPGGEKWAFSVMPTDNPAPMVHDGVRYTVTTVLRDSGVFIVAAEPANAPKPAPG